MKLSKKMMAAVLTATMVASSLTACGSSSGNDSTTAATTKGADATTAAGGTDATTKASENGNEEATTEATEYTVPQGVTDSADENADDDIVALIADDGLKPDSTVTLDVFSQLANVPGELTGWSGKLLQDKFNVKLNVICDVSGAYDTRMQEGNLGDIVVWGSNGDKYKKAVNSGMLWNWDDEDLLNEYGPYIAEHMKTALAANRTLNDDGGLYGFGHNVASSSADHETFMYSWDIRWDLYEQLGHPEVKNLDDYVSLLESMKQICPTDDNGKETYAASLWPDWDGNMVMYVKSTATAYYGYDEQALGIYDVDSGVYHDALEENGPYLEMLKFYNTLYQKGLLDPNSMTQTYTDMSEKMKVGGVFYSIFNYAGRDIYNTDEHLSQNKMMCSLTPDDCTPVVYGMSTYGGNRLWTIGANTQYPELCMAIINYLSTPDGYMEYNYGPKSLQATPDATDGCWYYKDGKTYFTKLGKACAEDRTTVMPEELGGKTFNDGCIQINNTTWSTSATNPISGERYDWHYWSSEQTEAKNDTEKDWRSFVAEKLGVENDSIKLPDEYLDAKTLADGSKAFKVAVATTYADADQSAELKAAWNQVTDAIVTGSWNAIYAKSDDEFDKIVSDMITNCYALGYEDCLAWSQEGAAERKRLEDIVKSGDSLTE